MSALSYWIWLSNAELSVRTKAALMEHYGDAETAFFAPAGEFAHIEGVSRADAAILERRDMSDTARIIEECQAQGLSVISYQDSAYPSRLRNIYAPPPVLYIKGRLPAVDDNAVIAVVGTRKATPYGLKMARTIAGEIVRCGGIVISGLTYGIDAAAAEGALNAGGICVGVLGTAHQDDAGVLYAGVAERGAVISEYAPGSPAQRSFFRDRNRITAGQWP